MLARLGTGWHIEAWSDNAVVGDIVSGAGFRILPTRGEKRVYVCLQFLNLCFIILLNTEDVVQGQWSPEDILELLQSPPFRQQVDSFTYVISESFVLCRACDDKTLGNQIIS